MKFHYINFDEEKKNFQRVTLNHKVGPQFEKVIYSSENSRIVSCVDRKPFIFILFPFVLYLTFLAWIFYIFKCLRKVEKN